MEKRTFRLMLLAASVLPMLLVLQGCGPAAIATGLASTGGGGGSTPTTPDFGAARFVGATGEETRFFLPLGEVENRDALISFRLEASVGGVDGSALVVDDEVVPQQHLAVFQAGRQLTLTADGSGFVQLPPGTYEFRWSHESQLGEQQLREVALSARARIGDVERTVRLIDPANGTIGREAPVIASVVPARVDPNDDESALQLVVNVLDMADDQRFYSYEVEVEGELYRFDRSSIESVDPGPSEPIRYTQTLRLDPLGADLPKGSFSDSAPLDISVRVIKSFDQEDNSPGTFRLLDSAAEELASDAVAVEFETTIGNAPSISEAEFIGGDGEPTFVLPIRLELRNESGCPTAPAVRVEATFSSEGNEAVASIDVGDSGLLQLPLEGSRTFIVRWNVLNDLGFGVGQYDKLIGAELSLRVVMPATPGSDAEPIYSEIRKTNVATIVTPPFTGQLQQASQPSPPQLFRERLIRPGGDNTRRGALYSDQDPNSAQTLSLLFTDFEPMDRSGPGYRTTDDFVIDSQVFATRQVPTSGLVDYSPSSDAGITVLLPTDFNPAAPDCIIQGSDDVRYIDMQPGLDPNEASRKLRNLPGISGGSARSPSGDVTLKDSANAVKYTISDPRAGVEIPGALLFSFDEEPRGGSGPDVLTSAKIFRLVRDSRQTSETWGGQERRFGFGQPLSNPYFPNTKATLGRTSAAWMVPGDYDNNSDNVEVVIATPGRETPGYRGQGLFQVVRFDKNLNGVPYNSLTNATIEKLPPPPTHPEANGEPRPCLRWFLLRVPNGRSLEPVQATNAPADPAGRSAIGRKPSIQAGEEQDSLLLVRQFGRPYDSRGNRVNNPSATSQGEGNRDRDPMEFDLWMLHQDAGGGFAGSEWVGLDRLHWDRANDRFGKPGRGFVDERVSLVGDRSRPANESESLDRVDVVDLDGNGIPEVILTFTRPSPRESPPGQNRTTQFRTMMLTQAEVQEILPDPQTGPVLIRPVWRTVFDYRKEIDTASDKVVTEDGVARYVDVNGDNLVDLLYLENSRPDTRDGDWYVHFSALTGAYGDDFRGSGFQQDSVGRRSQLTPIDFNLDGLVDYIAGGQLFQRKGEQYERVTVEGLPVPTSGAGKPEYGASGRFVVDPVNNRVSGANGAGLGDLDMLLWSQNPAQAGDLDRLWVVPLDLPEPGDQTDTVTVLASAVRRLNPGVLGAGEVIERCIPFANGRSDSRDTSMALVVRHSGQLSLRVLELRPRLGKYVALNRYPIDAAPEFATRVRRDERQATRAGERLAPSSTEDYLVMASADRRALLVFDPQPLPPIRIPEGQIIAVAAGVVDDNCYEDIVVVTESTRPQRRIRVYMVRQQGGQWSTAVSGPYVDFYPEDTGTDSSSVGLAFDSSAMSSSEGLLLFGDESRFLIPRRDRAFGIGSLQMVRSRLDSSSLLIDGAVELSVADTDGDGLSEVVGSIDEGGQFSFVRVNRGFRLR